VTATEAKTSSLGASSTAALFRTAALKIFFKHEHNLVAWHIYLYIFQKYEIEKKHLMCSAIQDAFIMKPI